jgi:outer membrane lipoprotein-sorting protein
MMGNMGESDLIRNGSDLWTWSSSSKSVSHAVLPSGDKSATGSEAPSRTTDLTPRTPAQLAAQAVAAITSSTRISTDPTAVVAGRPAYELVLAPRTDQTLIGSVRIAVDGATHIPTRVQVYATGATAPALSVGFTSFTPATPAPSVFDFTPPPGATVTEHSQHARSDHSSSASKAPRPTKGATDTTGRPTVVGSGWASVLVTAIPQQDTTTGSSGTASPPSASTGSLTSMLKALPQVSGAWGSGHLLQSSLLSAVLTTDGRLAIGAVPPQALYAALAQP